MNPTEEKIIASITETNTRLDALQANLTTINNALKNINEAMENIEVEVEVEDRDIKAIIETTLLHKKKDLSKVLE